MKDKQERRPSFLLNGFGDFAYSGIKRGFGGKLNKIKLSIKKFRFAN